MKTEVNPYESPREPGGTAIRGSRAGAVFFTINFGTAVTLGLLCIVAIAETIAGGGSPFSFIGGLCCIGPAAAFAIAEWLLFVRKHRNLRRPLGFACGASAAFVAFGFIANVFEAFAEGAWPPMAFWLIFGSISVALSSYGFYCCWHRLRDRRPPEMSNIR